MRRLPSGIRLSPPLPIQMFNKAGPLIKALGLWPGLQPKKMIAAAEHQCKLSKWPAAHLRALPARTSAFNNDAKLSLFGALAVKGQFMRGLTNSLRFENFIEEHPDIRDEKITRPLFVLGLPRTGTTLLQRLLCMHAGARYLPFWEGYAPLPKVLGAGQDGSDGRIDGAKRALALMKWIAPDMDKNPSLRCRRSRGVLPHLQDLCADAAGLRFLLSAQLLAGVQRSRPPGCLPAAQAAAANLSVAKPA